MNFPYKLFDTENIAPMGRVEQDWRQRAFEMILGSKREGKRIPSSFSLTNQKQLLAYFNLRAFEYGNWLNQEERFEFLTGAALSLYDLSEAINYPHKKIGLGKKISIAFGARGKSAALAHFEPGTYAINLTKFGSEREQRTRVFSGGGVGSLGHEWGHALDFFVGKSIEASRFQFITENIIDAIKKDGNYFIYKPSTNKTIKAAQDLMQSIMFVPVKRGSKLYDYSPYYKRLQSLIESGMGNYWIRTIEVFARGFETHLFYQGKKKKIVNPTLFKNKYTAAVYLTEAEYKKSEKYFIALFTNAKSLIPSK